MRETPLSSCEREFILKAITEHKRFDGRQAYDYRKVKISFGVDRGCCQVQLGDTRVLAQVSCEITAPKPTRPTDGVLFVNVELSPMASPGFEIGRPSEFGVELTRLLERCLKESRCVDTESLCVVAGEKVWAIRVDIHALNYEGNLLDAASVAAIAAIAHFRRPDVTVSGEEVTVHSPEERDPVPLSVHHMPICCTFAFFTQGKHLLVDPSLVEEKVMDGKMVIGMNKHREICMLQITGEMLLLKEQVLRCSNIAVVKVTEISELILKALENDRVARASGEKCGFAESVEPKKITTTKTDRQDVDMEEDAADKTAEASQSSDDDMQIARPGDSSEVKVLDKGLAAIGEGGQNTWEMDDDAATEAMADAAAATSSRLQGKGDNQHQVIDLDSGSEEETTVTLSHDDLQTHRPTTSPAQPASGKSEAKKGKKKKKK
ncbi:exosome complex component RRP45-like [Haliotis cracherodii]|uniref:exosome complex component RRP45-like n=1 Tax=Haliotis cracherodii TaxID=6455 RepID=UPI0039E7ECF0